jgi:hypothetical protein
MLTNRHELFYQASRITELADHRSFYEFADRLSTDACHLSCQVYAAESAPSSGSCFESHNCGDRERRRRVLMRFAQERKRQSLWRQIFTSAVRHGRRGRTASSVGQFQLLQSGCPPAPADSIRPRQRSRPQQRFASSRHRLLQTKLCIPSLDPTTNPLDEESGFCQDWHESMPPDQNLL